jgi:hypothetical protein
MNDMNDSVLNFKHTTEQPTEVYHDDPTSVRQAGLSRALKLWRYPADEQWSVSVKSRRHSYEVRKVDSGALLGLNALEVYRDGRRLAS